MSTNGKQLVSITCIFCGKALETDGRMNWWHSLTGYQECELYAAPHFTYSDGSHH